MQPQTRRRKRPQINYNEGKLATTGRAMWCNADGVPGQHPNESAAQYAARLAKVAEKKRLTATAQFRKSGNVETKEMAAEALPARSRPTPPSSGWLHRRPRRRAHSSGSPRRDCTAPTT